MFHTYAVGRLVLQRTSYMQAIKKRAFVQEMWFRTTTKRQIDRCWECHETPEDYFLVFIFRPE